ncbi:MAG: molybdenum cofactor guanylyltransferase MobA [Rhodospirillaceae bacterium]|nr:molybdenum cofactor guanylyltransferase MobA [Rhodospirillaceae bacterium]
MTPVAGVLLAGGLARRMGGGDKCLRPLAGETLLARVIARVAPQVGPLILNANGDPARFASFGLPVVADVVEGYAGPLAGILTALDWAAENAPHHPLVASFATDAPFLPRDMVEVMVEARDLAGADLACAVSGGRTHPVFGLWPVEFRADLRHALVEQGERKIDRWTASHRLVEVVFPCDPVDHFFNANRADDLAKAERLIAAHGAEL